MRMTLTIGSEASKYYGELRAREDYMARRQVDLERHLMRLLQQAGWGGLCGSYDRRKTGLVLTSCCDSTWKFS